MLSVCSLCSLKLPKNPLVEGEEVFCCSGCLTVFAIIGQQQDAASHPLFQEALRAGVISNPGLRVPQEENTCEQKEALKFHLHVEGMWCPACAEAIRLILLRQKGVSCCLIDYATDMAIITLNPRMLSKQNVIDLIAKLGYQARELLTQERKKLSFSLGLRLAMALFCTMNIMMFSYPLYAAYFGWSLEGYGPAFGWFSFALALPLVTYCAWPIWRRLKMSFRSGLFGMETLMALGVGSAFCVSTFHLFWGVEGLYFDSLSMVITFVLLGKLLEKKAKFSAKETLFKLTYCLPKKAYKKVGEGKFAYVPLKEVASGDILFIRRGEKILFDGVVLEGEGHADETVMTGEAMPQTKQAGSPVLGGSLLTQGSLVMQVVKEHNHSLIGQILLCIEHDLLKKASVGQLVNQVTRIFIPFVLSLSLLALFLFGFSRSLAILLISCPCAMGIAIPLVHSRLYYRFAEKGALVRSRNCLHLLGKNPFFVFDKTGTLTEGKFEVLRGLDTMSPDHLDILKALTTVSAHPISVAICHALNCTPAILEWTEEVAGRGVRGGYLGIEYFLGSERFLKDHGLSIPSCESDFTVAYFATQKQILAHIHLGDRLRSRLPRVEGGILSGDSPKLVSGLAETCGFSWGMGGMDPLQKREEILKLKNLGRPIVMVGDGINDAPAMTAADVGISVISATDLAVEVSDILLTTEHLDALPALCKLAQESQKIIYQNLFWAFFYNGLAVLCAFCGLMDPFLAALVMAVSSVCVTLNSLRL
jgi:heavy metal translocating P-type ATPase